MFGRNFTLFELLGFRVRANVSWLFLAILVVWSLAAGYFPAAYPELPATTYWWLGIVATIGLFFSLLFHEFSHSVVARARGLEIKGITLFLFGGVSEMAMEPARPNDEFWIAIAGPAASVVLAGLFYLLASGLQALSVPDYVSGVPAHLAFLNLVLAGFNMVPGFSARRGPGAAGDPVALQGRFALGHALGDAPRPEFRVPAGRLRGRRHPQRQFYRRALAVSDRAVHERGCRGFLSTADRAAGTQDRIRARHHRLSTR